MKAQQLHLDVSLDAIDYLIESMSHRRYGARPL